MDAHAALVAGITALLPATRPVLVGVAGGVAAGKSTLARELRDRLARGTVEVEIVGTDAFLLPNEELERRQLTMRKGFPETFDAGALEAFVRAVHDERAEVRLPVYSHTTYDRVPDASRLLEPADVLIIEGVNALQPPVVDHLDLAVYIEATEEDMQAWFVDRFVAFCVDARDDPAAFYHGFAGMSEAQQRDIAEWTWREINLVNLRDHIAPSKARATVVLSKRRDHSIRSSA